MHLSVVTTLYYSAPHLEEFYKRITASAQKLTNNYEIIFVNDGSPDHSLDIALGIHRRDKKITVIDLSRNFGHHKAIMTGLSFAKGEKVFLIDSDLEEDPELLEKFWSELHSKENVDVVYGIQTRRRGSWLGRGVGNLFYSILNFFSEVKIRRNVIVARLMKKYFVDSLLNFREREVVFVGISELTGFNQKPVYVEKRDRGSTTYHLRLKVLMAINFIVSLSSKPLEFIFYLGIAVSSLSFVFVLKLIGDRLIFKEILRGWTSILVSVWLLGGIIILSIGIVGIYISKIFIEVKQRPYSIIKKVYSSD